LTSLLDGAVIKRVF